ncbi:MAG TPA: IPT/TIG domain-containing protein [Bryobacteraceae bacterium]|nr:IPT/TIG domain-containing protein [Bryobacteraceae bacterium]
MALAGLAAAVARADEAPAIVSATVDYTGNQITITGANFSPNGLAPTVAIDTAPLALVSFTDQTAAVSLPAVWASGFYLLAVTNSNRQTGLYRMRLEASLDKLRYHARGLYGPWALAGTGAYAGILQELNAPREWGQGGAAYGRRVASTEAAAVIHTVLAFSLDSALREDPRYFRSSRKGMFRRVADAARGTFLTRTDVGGETVSTWRLGSAYGAAILSNLWYPDRLDTMRLGFLQGTVRVGFDLVTNISSEFWPDIKKKLLRRN